MADKYLMEGHKLHWHLNKVVDWQEGKPVVPVTIDMGINQVCNIACKFCFFSVATNQKTDKIPTESLLKFLTDAAESGVRAIYFAGDGEPLLHPGIWDAVAHGASVGLDMGISTNGVAMKSSNIEGILKSLKLIRFTFPAAQPEVYAEITGTRETTYLKVLENIKKCVEIKKKHNLEIAIGMHMVLIPEAVEEILPYARLGRDLGVDYAVVKQYSEGAGTNRKDLLGVDYEKLMTVFDQAESYSSDTYSFIVKRSKMQKYTRAYDSCYGTEFLAHISGDGDMFPCENFSGDRNFFMGNIIDESFVDIIYGKRYREVLSKVSNDVDVHKQCGSPCRPDQINEYLWELKQQPEHTNFI